jgi:hypothetical protein
MTATADHPISGLPAAPPEPRFRESFVSAAFWFGHFDTLPLGLFRIVFSAILAWVYIDLLPDAGAFYADTGILPRSTVMDYGRAVRFSLLDTVGSVSGAYAFLSAGIAISLVLLVGYRARLMAVLSFLWLLSLHERNLMPLDGADTVMRVLAFWLMFCPVDRALSLDSVLAAYRGRPLSRAGPVFAFRLLQLQLAVVYLYAAWEKMPGQRWPQGSALHYVLNLGEMWARPTAALFGSSPAFCYWGTIATLAFEVLFLPLVFLPYFQPRLKAIALATGTAFHAGIAATLKVGWFSYLMPACYLIYLEPRWIERLGAAVRSRTRRPAATLEVNPASAIALGWARVVRRLDWLGRVRVVDETPPVTGRLALIDGRGRLHLDARAVAVLTGLLPLLWPVRPLLALPGMHATLERFFEREAHRAEMRAQASQVPGRNPSVLPTTVHKTALWSARALLMILFVAAVTYGIADLLRIPLARFVSAPVQAVGLWQAWGMFAPEPWHVEGHIYTVGVFEDGARIDLTEAGLAHGGWNPSKPYYKAIYFSRWNKVVETLIEPDAEPYAHEYCAWVAQELDRERRPGSPRLKAVEVHWLRRPVPPPGAVLGEFRDELLWVHEPGR